MRSVKLWSVLMLSAMVLAGCGSSSKSMESAEAVTESYDNSMYGDIVYEESAEVTTESAEEMKATENGSGVISQGTTDINTSTERKLIKTVDMNLETLEYEKTIEYIQNSVSEVGGYIENLSLDGKSIYNYGGHRYATLKARVPKDKTDTFLKGLDENTTVRSKSESTEDVTLEYVDVESHKKALKVEQERLMAILEQATTLEDILEIESRLSEVRYEIQNYESRLRIYDNLVDYTTINIEVSEVEEITKEPKETALERMTAGFVDSFEDIVYSIKEFIIGFVIAIPYLILYGIIIVIIIFIVKAIRKKMRIKKEKRQQQMQQQAQQQAQPQQNQPQENNKKK